ncbi:MAG TPA: agmatinase [Ignavibacteria bacterium]|nr:agmatinase [Ignavibacteria bacterium]HRK00193.1 agmatinase [Ignavibacteria bacterium]
MNKSIKFYGEKKNFLAIESKYSDYFNSGIVIIQAPYEHTTSYGKGTADGPKAIIKASQYVEFFDEELNRELCFEKSNGICTLYPLIFKDKKSRDALDYIYSNVTSHIQNGKFVVLLGGEHSVSTAPVKAHFEKYSDLSVLQFDAHSDFREEYEGSKFSHASVMARVAEFTKDITQVGIRAQCREEYEFIKKNKIDTFYAHDIRSGKFGYDWQSKVIDTLKENVYITFDVDYFDPSIMMSTGTPEPNGLYWDETMKLLKLLGESRNVVGFDVVELAPRNGFPYPDFMTAKLIYKMLNYFRK